MPVYFSTDYVFDGRQRSPYREVDPPGPLGVYATSELAVDFPLDTCVLEY